MRSRFYLTTYVLPLIAQSSGANFPRKKAVEQIPLALNVSFISIDFAQLCSTLPSYEKNYHSRREVVLVLNEIPIRSTRKLSVALAIHLL